MSAGSYTGETARLIVVTAILVALALLATTVLDTALGPPLPIAGLF